MSISLEEARRKLDILEKLASDPSLILTELFSEGISGRNFLYQVKVDGKYILDYLKEYLSELPIFNGCKINSNCEIIVISVESLKTGKYAKYISNDDIVKINADERTYKLLNRAINTYENIMSEKYTLKTKELDEYWKKFIDLTPRKRIINLINSLKSNKKVYIRILDSIFWITASKKKVLYALDRETKKINQVNEYNIKQYNDNIQNQKYYYQYAPEHINKIKYKQKEISDYLLSIGYKEDNEMSDY